MVSMSFGAVTDIDTSGSIMRYDLPQGVYGDHLVRNNIGVLFSPSELPATNCSYTIDASTSSRLLEGDKSRCGRGVLDGTLVLDSGECPDDQTSDQYADAYYFQPRGIRNEWRPDLGTCHQNDPQETLAAQKALFLKIATEVDGEELWNDLTITRKGAPPSAYNEFVLKDILTVEDITAYVWAHGGAFYEDIRECPQLLNDDCRLCTLRKQLCSDVTGPRPNNPLVEIANQNIANFYGRLTYENITSYKDIIDNNGGYDADMIFRELSWEDVCGEGLSPSFSDACPDPN